MFKKQNKAVLGSNQDESIMLRRRGLNNNQLKYELQSLNYCFLNITELDLSRNRLTSLPSQIIHLKNLKILNLVSNQINIIPTELYKLQSLQVLNLSQNKIKTIPHEMPINLRNLVTLRIAANQIDQLPSSLHHWAHMKHFELGSVYGGNQLTKLPKDIINMSQLEELDISNNQLSSIPNHFVIPTLNTLNLSNNHLDYIPNTIAHCHRLVSLNLSKNNLTSLPSDLMNLQQLKSLDISDNLLCILPSEILENMSSTTLLITGNPLTRPSHSDSQNKSQDTYTQILKQMTQKALSRSSSPASSPSLGRRNLTDQGSSIRDQPSHQDDDAIIDHELSFHAQQLNIHRPRPSYGHQDTLTGIAISPVKINSPRLASLDSSLDDFVSDIQLLPSLCEIAARTVLMHHPGLSLQHLPEHLAQGLKYTKTCSHCHKPFVNEWVTSVQVKEFGGHPAVVRRVRFCSVTCWNNCMPPDAKPIICVQK
ncbi:hypothetical protein G6F62_009058 [Rhizopus arrhizus]|nr:hypothetical protein G6F62_009058 [Rhizopus arrhizus]